MQDHEGLAVTVAKLHPMHLREAQSQRTQTSLRLHGSYRMLLKRPYRTPELSRPYQFGDPLAMIDWKAFARTDQLIVREQRNEAAAHVQLVIDASASMAWPNSPDLPFCQASKLELACRIALHLAHRHLRAGDPVQMWLVTERSSLQPQFRWQPHTAAEVLRAFHQLTSKGFAAHVLTPYFRKHILPPPSAKSDLCYWIGDTIGQADHLSFLTRGRRQVLFHTLSSLETDLSWMHASACYFDQDVDNKEFLGSQLNKDQTFSDTFTGWQKQQQEAVTARRGRYLLITDKTNLSTYLNFVDDLSKR